MLENPTSAAADPASVVKRYAPPNQRNRPLNRRKSAERFDRTNNLHGNDLEKNQIASSRGTVIDHGDGGSSSLLNENSHPWFIALEGCCSSQAFDLLNNRWAATMHCFNDSSIDLSERPVMYSGSGAAWGHFRLPHQLMAPAGGAGSPVSSMDFLSELCRLKHNSNVSSGI
ncbi:uncharacterized protein LOC133746486 isoform X1 [Rosa rugosa]|uniref:uncharacterized protein LOC133746486 isoform X1 n=1 Tax=Rosa rugosa TaxID=74645 RepID=UPI002B406A2F|nr:uncharacterized protein LOC133746486 isoform X1 [Rosa rugosa]